MKTVIFLAKLNGHEVYNTDISSAYLESYRTEKVFIIGGPEFEELEGHILIIDRALYGLRFSGKLFGELFFEILEDQWFKPSKAEPQIWMRPTPDKDGYEYVATYVDDLLLAMKDTKGFIKILESKPYCLKFNGTSKIDFHLGADFGRDPSGTLYMSPRHYIERIEETYEKFFGGKPKRNVSSPLRIITISNRTRQS